MAALTTKLLNQTTGAAPALDAAAATANTAEVGNGKNTFYRVVNGSAAPITVTVAVPGKLPYAGIDAPDPQYTVNDGEEAWIPLRKEYDKADGSGRCDVTLSAFADVEHAVVRVQW